MRRTVTQRFWRFVDRGADDACWEWTGNKVRRGNDLPYGQFSLSTAKNVYAHRFAFELAHGPIPAEHQIHHTCCNRLCINPRHLEAVHRLHHPDGGPAMRRAMTRCCYGHPYTPENTFIRTTGTRRCRACDWLASRARRTRPWLEGLGMRAAPTKDGAETIPLHPKA